MNYNKIIIISIGVFLIGWLFYDVYFNLNNPYLRTFHRIIIFPYFVYIIYNKYYKRKSPLT